MSGGRFDPKLEILRKQYSDNAQEAQEHRDMGHEMSMSSMSALVPKGDIVSLDCECGRSFAMPFITRQGK